MSIQTANRLVFLFACAGAFVALVLGLAHIAGAKLPCGVPGEAMSGCDIVAEAPVSRIGGIPIAFFGLGAYLLVAVGALAREWRGLPQTQKLGVWMWLVLAAGTLISAGLLSYAWIGLSAVCLWCTASGILMLLALLAQTVAVEGRDVPAKRLPGWALALPLAVALLAGGVYGGILMRQTEEMIRAREYHLPPGAVLEREGNHHLGASNAPVLLVVFADLQCPACRRASMMKVIEDVEGRLHGKVRLVYRHFIPQRNNSASLEAALLAEWAGSQGKFWDFVTTFLREGSANREGMLKVVRSIGLDERKAKRVLEDKKLQKPYAERLQTDLADAQKLEVTFTPTWFVRYPDGKVDRAFGGNATSLLRDEVMATHSPKRR